MAVTWGGLHLQLSLKNNSRCFFVCFTSYSRLLFAIKDATGVRLSSTLDFNWVSPGLHDAGRFLLRIIAFSDVVLFCLWSRPGQRVACF